MAVEPLGIGVCSWSLQVTSIPGTETIPHPFWGLTWCKSPAATLTTRVGMKATRCPPRRKRPASACRGAMLGFPGEDYTTPQTIEKTGGFGDPATRSERLERFKWGLARTKELGLTDIMLHAGFIPEIGSPERKSFLDTLAIVSDLARTAGITVAFETGQESATLLRRTLDDLKSPNLKVNFDPANMLLYDKDDPLEVLELLAPDIRSVHVKDANRPRAKGTWGEEVPLGTGQTNTKAFVKAAEACRLSRGAVHRARSRHATRSIRRH